MADRLLTCRDLTIGRGGIRMCEGISFSVSAGEYMCVVGPSGCGKSTLVDTLLGIVPPISGEVKYGSGLLRSDIGCMPQSLDLMGTSLVRDIVIAGCLGRMKRLFVGRAEKELAMHNLERMGVADLSKRRFGELSGGQKQRVLLARALCETKKLLILDEPMTGLDIIAKDELFSEIVKIHRDDGIAVIMIDSDAIDGTVLHMSDRMLYCGPVESYCESVAGKFFFAGRII